jgi:hypothetical protein
MSASSPPVATTTTSAADVQLVELPSEPKEMPKKHTIADKVNHINKRVDTLDTKVHDIEKTLVTPPPPPVAVSLPPVYNDLFEFL